MIEVDPGYVVSQMEGLRPIVPMYDYEGLVLPEGLELHAFFGSHEDKGDPDELRQRLGSGDAIVMESFGWLPDLPKMFQKLSRGDYKTRTRWLEGLQLDGSISSQWAAQTVRALYDIGKPILITDIPAKDPIFKALKKCMDSPEPNGTFSEAMQQTRDQQLKYAELNMQRENYMLRSFVEQVNNLLGTNPKLQQKLQNGNKVKLQTIDFGLVHAGVYEGIREVGRRSGVDISGDVTFDRAGSSYHSQIVGRFNRGLEIDDELFAKELVCKTIVKHLFEEDSTLCRSEAEYIAMQKLDSMNITELEELYKELS